MVNWHSTNVWHKTSLNWHNLTTTVNWHNLTTIVNRHNLTSGGIAKQLIESRNCVRNIISTSDWKVILHLDSDHISLTEWVIHFRGSGYASYFCRFWYWLWFISLLNKWRSIFGLDRYCGRTKYWQNSRRLWKLQERSIYTYIGCDKIIQRYSGSCFTIHLKALSYGNFLTLVLMVWHFPAAFAKVAHFYLFGLWSHVKGLHFASSFHAISCY